MRIEYHRSLIADIGRLAAFERALAKVIRKGETVVADIGTGSGVLAMIAAKLGARKVIAYEFAEIGALAERLVKLNKLRNIELIPMRSTEIIEPERADVVVTETLGNYALEEFLVETMNDAKARHLKPGGVLIPGGLEQVVVPVIAPRCRDELVAWERIGRGLNFGPANTMSLNNAYVRMFPPAELLDKGRTAATWDRLDFHARNRFARKGTAEWPIAAPVTVHGLAVWWVAELVPGVVLSTSPLAAPTHWEQLFLPALEPMELKAGETLAVQVRSHSSEEGGTDLAWSFRVRTAKGKQRLSQDLSLEKGFLP
ncbi:MAG: ribonucleotide-diphosphate reductase subunit beta [Hyphomicrobium sp. SCN 65-11]|nr:MAG: ribonucleotide-diphosphate reductase subunit beta [Hyphomicrobium sp. SCN 65-11]